MMMATWQMVVGAIAQDATAVPGIHQSVWTAVTSITSVIFGTDAFHGSFHFWSVAFGLMGHMANSMMLGVVALALGRFILGARTNPFAGTMLGVAVGVILEVVIVNKIVNRIQDVETLYTSTPEWSWWMAHGIFGMTSAGSAPCSCAAAPTGEHAAPGDRVTTTAFGDRHRRDGGAGLRRDRLGVALAGLPANWATGLLWGAILTVLALWMMSTIGAVHPAIRRGEQTEPGPAATNFGSMTPLGSLMGTSSSEWCSA